VPFHFAPDDFHAGLKPMGYVSWVIIREMITFASQHQWHAWRVHRRDGAGHLTLNSITLDQAAELECIAFSEEARATGSIGLTALITELVTFLRSSGKYSHILPSA
jgi:hypothetical protein